MDFNYLKACFYFSHTHSDICDIIEVLTDAVVVIILQNTNISTCCTLKLTQYYMSNIFQLNVYILFIIMTGKRVYFFLKRISITGLNEVSVE